VFAEASPHPVLTMAVTEAAEARVDGARVDGARVDGARVDGARVDGARAGGSAPAGANSAAEAGVGGAAGGPVTVTGTLRRGDGGPARLLASLAEAWCAGAAVSWPSVLPPVRPARGLPTYAFQHQRYWLDAPPFTGEASGLGLDPAGHPLLSAAVSPAGTGTVLLTGRISLATHSWLADHAVMGVTMLPGSVLLDWALHAGHYVGCAEVSDIALETPLILGPAADAMHVQVTVTAPDTEGRRELAIYSRPERSGDADASWTRHAHATLARAASTPSPADDAYAGLAGEWPPAGASLITAGDYYGALAERGYEYGPAFQGLRAVWRRGDDVFAEAVLPDETADTADRSGLHPVLFDAICQAHFVADPDPSASAETLLLPAALSGVRLWGAGAGAVRVWLSGGSGPVRVRVSDGPGAASVVGGRGAVGAVGGGRLAVHGPLGADRAGAGRGRGRRGTRPGIFPGIEFTGLRHRCRRLSPARGAADLGGRRPGR
jgi:acyl transferase domain-containing protein